MIKAAGILFVSNGKALLLKRSNTESHPKEWAFPGGHIEEGETPEQAALREFQEECGLAYTGELSQIMRTNDGDVEFTTFLAQAPEQFKPILNDEHTGFGWFELDDYPNKTHPQVKSLFQTDKVRDAFIGSEAVRADSVVTELDVAKQIRDNLLTSPQKFSNVWLFALRITGTGLSFRPKYDEFVERLPENCLNDEFLARCNGLPVIWIHPPKEKLDSESFAERVVGTIFLPYIAGDEVWGIAKIFDAQAAEIMTKEQLSTSPGVVFSAGINEEVQLSDGSTVLVEGKPSLVDHLAICEQGVWDKGGEPSGVLSEVAHVEMTEASRNDSAGQSDSSIKGEAKMAEEIKKDDAVEAQGNSAESEMLTLLKGIAAKQEAIEARLVALEGEEAEEKEIMEEKSDDESMPAATLAPVEEKAEAPAYVADMQKRLDDAEAELKAIKANAARADDAEEVSKLAAAQKKCDDVDQAYGDSAPRPLQGESLMAYRKRLLGRHIARSATWKDADIASIKDDKTLGAIEDQVYADSMAAANAAIHVPEGRMVEFTRDMGTGRKITEFRGKDSFVKGMAPAQMGSKIYRQTYN